MMFSESQFDGGSQMASSPATAAASRDTIGLVPLTIKQISEASHSGDDKSNFVLSGSHVVNFDDGTVKLSCKKWVNEPVDKLLMEEVRDGIYVHVDGHLKSFRGERHVDVFSVRPVTNFDEITFHFVACIHNHVRTSKDQKMQGNGTTSSDGINSTPHTPIQNGTNGSKLAPSSQLSVPFSVDGLKGFDQMVLAYLQLPENYGNEKGFHTDELAQKLKLPKNKIMYISLPLTFTPEFVARAFASPIMRIGNIFIIDICTWESSVHLKMMVIYLHRMNSTSKQPAAVDCQVSDFVKI
ncbi:replication protein A 32 kDa subunit A [Tanacetum coccineum]